jgi:hypothetical protein
MDTKENEKREYDIQRQIIQLVSQATLKNNKEYVDTFVLLVSVIIKNEKVPNGVVVTGLWQILKDYLDELRKDVIIKKELH